MKWKDYIAKKGSNISKLISNLDTRLTKRECFTKAKSYTTTEMNAIKDPEVGYIIYNTTATALYVYKLIGWTAV